MTLANQRKIIANATLREGNGANTIIDNVEATIQGSKSATASVDGNTENIDQGEHRILEEQLSRLHLLQEWNI